MRIDSSSLALAATHSLDSRREVREQLTVTTGSNRSPQRNGEREAGATEQTETLERDLDFRRQPSNDGLAERLVLARRIAPAPPALVESLPAMAELAPPTDEATAAAGATDEVALLDAAGFSEPELALIEAFVERLTGRRLRLFSGREIASAGHPHAHGEGATPARPAFGAIYRRHEEVRETEQMHFQAAGVVKTADGRDITLDLRINMSRSLIQTRDTELRVGAALKDPLVINLDGNAARLTSTRFSFDLDADGDSEQVAGLAPGSAWLALDRNGDGKINNGSELFGPQTGNGFAELASLDGDGNGWIDEADAAWSQLKVWRRDASGNDQLLALADAGVGALYLGSAATPFSLRDGSGTTALGQLRSSGLFLFEDGRVGGLQQVDLSV